MKHDPFFFLSKEKTETHLPNREILYYAVGLTGQNISYSFLSNRLTYFYENHAVSEKNAGLVGKLMSATYVWDAINDIFIGAWVDARGHKPYKKLFPYLAWFPPFIGLLAALMFVPVGASDVFRLIWLGLCYFLWDFLYSFQDVGLWGLISLSSPHSAERGRVAQWVSIGAGAGGAIGGAFPMLWDIFEKSLGMPERQIFTVFAFVFGLGGELLSLTAARFRERVDTPVQKHENPLQAAAMIRHNPTLILISLARFFKDTYPKVNQTYFFQSEYRDGAVLQGGTAEMVYGIVSGVPGSVALFFANRVIAALGGAKRMLIISQVLAVGVRLAGFFVGRIPGVKYNTLPGFILMAAIVSVANIPGSLMDIAHRTLISDSIDEVEYKTGLRTEGVSFSMQNFTSKITNGAGTLIQNFFLYKVLGYRAYKDENYIAMQNETFYKWQFPLFMLGPIVGAVLYILVIAFIKDDPARRDEIERELKKRREQTARADAAQMNG